MLFARIWRTRQSSRSGAPGQGAAVTPADSHGAIDLSARRPRPPLREYRARGGGACTFRSSPPPTRPIPGRHVDVASFPSSPSHVVVVPSLESKPTLAMLEEVTRARGCLPAVEVDIDKAPQIAQAFQIQAVLTVVAPSSAAGRPVPFFQGSAGKGLRWSPSSPQDSRGRRPDGDHGSHAAVAAEDTAAPILPEHEAPLAAEEEGRLDEVDRPVERVVELNSRRGRCQTCRAFALPPAPTVSTMRATRRRAPTRSSLPETPPLPLDAPEFRGTYGRRGARTRCARVSSISSASRSSRGVEGGAHAPGDASYGTVCATRFEPCRTQNDTRPEQESLAPASSHEPMAPGTREAGTATAPSGGTRS